MTEETPSERQFEEAVRLISERYRARRAGIDAAESKANVWFDGEGDQVAYEALSAALEDGRLERYWPEATRKGPRDRRPLLSIAPQIASPGGDG